MPFKFWKKDKPEDRPPGSEQESPAPSQAVTVQVEAPAPEPPLPEAEPEPLQEASATLDPATVVRTVHEGLVALGLTTAATKDIFAKRAAAYPGGIEGFAEVYAAEPYRPATEVLAGWLALRARTDFDPEELLAQVNPRLSSFGISIEMEGLAWLDQDLGLRKARLRLGPQEKVARFKDPRDFLRAVNELIAARKVALVELETWSEDLAFLLVRDPNWEGLGATDLVVVKDPQTATGGECGECGAKVGNHWNDCLNCGVVFG